MLCSMLFIVIKNIFDTENCHRLIVVISECNVITHVKASNGLFVFVTNRSKAQWHRPNRAIAQTTISQHRQIIFFIHKAINWRKYASGNHFNGDHSFKSTRMQGSSRARAISASRLASGTTWLTKVPPWGFWGYAAKSSEVED